MLCHIIACHQFFIYSHWHKSSAHSKRAFFVWVTDYTFHFFFRSHSTPTHRGSTQFDCKYRGIFTFREVFYQKNCVSRLFFIKTAHFYRKKHCGHPGYCYPECTQCRICLLNHNLNFHWACSRSVKSNKFASTLT